MNRRSFLKLFAAAGSVAAAAPTYFFAPIGGWKSDVIVNPNEVPYYIQAGMGQLSFYNFNAPAKTLYPNTEFLRPRLSSAFPVLGSTAIMKIIEEQARAMRDGREWRP